MDREMYIKSVPGLKCANASRENAAESASLAGPLQGYLAQKKTPCPRTLQ